jgi:GTPase SAR1 family protein
LLAYPFSDLVLICFEMGSADSLSSVTEKWLVEISHHCHNKPPCFLVGLKADGAAAVSMADIQAVQSANPQCTKIYVLSAKTEANKVKELFNDAISAAITQKKKIVAEEHAAEASASKGARGGGGGGRRGRGCTLL